MMMMMMMMMGVALTAVSIMVVMMKKRSKNKRTKKVQPTTTTTTGEEEQITMNQKEEEEEKSTESKKIENPIIPITLVEIKKEEQEDEENNNIRSSLNNNVNSKTITTTLAPEFPFLKISNLIPKGVPETFLPNTREAIRFDSDTCDGNMFVMLRTNPMDPEFAWAFERKKRRFDIHFQLTFKVDPKGVVYLGGELPRKMHLGLATDLACKGILAVVKRLASNLHASFGDSDENGESSHIVFPLWQAADRLILSKPGESLPPIGKGPIMEKDEDRAIRLKDNKLGRNIIRKGDTVTFSFHSAYLDLVEWKVCGLGIRDQNLSMFWDTMPLRVVIYDVEPSTKRHVKSAKRYYLRFELKNSWHERREDEEFVLFTNKSMEVEYYDDEEGGVGREGGGGDVMREEDDDDDDDEEGRLGGTFDDGDDDDEEDEKSEGSSSNNNHSHPKFGGVGGKKITQQFSESFKNIKARRSSLKKPSGKFLSNIFTKRAGPTNSLVIMKPSPPTSPGSRRGSALSNAFANSTGTGGGGGGTSGLNGSLLSPKLQPFTFDQGGEDEINPPSPIENFDLRIKRMEEEEEEEEGGGGGDNKSSSITPKQFSTFTSTEIARPVRLGGKVKLNIENVESVQQVKLFVPFWIRVRGGKVVFCMRIRHVLKNQEEKLFIQDFDQCTKIIPTATWRCNSAHGIKRSEREWERRRRILDYEARQGKFVNKSQLMNTITSLTSTTTSQEDESRGGGGDNNNNEIHLLNPDYARFKKFTASKRYVGPDVGRICYETLVLRNVNETQWQEEWMVLIRTNDSKSVFALFFLEKKVPIRILGSGNVLDLIEVDVPHSSLHGFHEKFPLLEVETLSRKKLLAFPSKSARSKVKDIFLSSSQNSITDIHHQQQQAQIPSAFSFALESIFVEETRKWPGVKKKRIVLNGRISVYSRRSLEESVIGDPISLIKQLLKQALQLKNLSHEAQVSFFNDCSKFKCFDLLEWAMFQNFESRVVFFLNLYHTILAHARYMFGQPSSQIRYESFANQMSYEFGVLTNNACALSLSEIEHRILRPFTSSMANYSSKGGEISVPPSTDATMALCVRKRDARITFAINRGNSSCMEKIQVFSLETLSRDLNEVSKAYLDEFLIVDLSKRRIRVPKLCEWYFAELSDEDFAICSPKAAIGSILQLLSREKMTLLSSLAGGTYVNIAGGGSRMNLMDALEEVNNFSYATGLSSTDLAHQTTSTNNLMESSSTGGGGATESQVRFDFLKYNWQSRIE